MIFRTLERLLRPADHAAGPATETWRVESASRILATLREFEDFCHTQPMVDELALLAEFSRIKGVDASRVDDAEVTAAIEAGVRCLVSPASVRDDGGWGWPEPRRVTATALRATARTQAVSLTWDTAISLIALGEWLTHSLKPTIDVNDALCRGREWLLAAQGPDGGWSEFGCRYSELPGDAVETGVALWALNTLSVGLGIPLPERVSASGLRFFHRLQAVDGGTRARLDAPSDVKASSMAILVHLALGVAAAASSLITTNVAWLLRQHEHGYWGQPPEGHFIDPAFYAISALQAFQFRSTLDDQTSAAIEAAATATVDWYLDQARFTRERGRPGWAWRDVENTAAALSVLLNCGVPSMLPSVQKGVHWLLTQRDADHAWRSETALTVIALLRYIKPGSRLSERMKAQAAFPPFHLRTV